MSGERGDGREGVCVYVCVCVCERERERERTYQGQTDRSTHALIMSP